MRAPARPVRWTWTNAPPNTPPALVTRPWHVSICQVHTTVDPAHMVSCLEHFVSRNTTSFTTTPSISRHLPNPSFLFSPPLYSPPLLTPPLITSSFTPDFTFAPDYRVIYPTPFYPDHFITPSFISPVINPSLTVPFITTSFIPPLIILSLYLLLHVLHPSFIPSFAPIFIISIFRSNTQWYQENAFF